MNFSTVNFDNCNFSPSRMNMTEITTLFFYLLKNNRNFREQFINVFCDYANEVFNPIKVNKILE